MNAVKNDPMPALGVHILQKKIIRQFSSIVYFDCLSMTSLTKNINAKVDMHLDTRDAQNG